MSTVATLLVRVAGDTKDAEKAFDGLERAGKALDRAFAGLGTRLSGVGGDLAKGLGSSLSGIESAAGKAFGALDQGLGKVGQALAPIASVLPGLPSGVQALAGAFGGFVPIPGLLGGVGVALGAIGGIAVGVVGGLIALGKSAADAGDAMLVLSQQSGISVENLSRFQYVEQQTDASVDKIVTSIRKLGTNLVSGSTEAQKAITSIGLSLADVKKLKPEDAFVAIVDGLGKIPGAAQRAHAGAAIFGKGWHDVSQLATEDLRGLMEEADRFGATMSTELAVAGDRFNDTLGQLSTVFEGFKRAAGAGVLPVLTAFAEVLRDQVIVWLEATGTTAATVQGTFEAFALKVAVAMLQITASVAQAMAEITTFFSSRIIVDSPVYQAIEKFIRSAKVLDSIKPGEALWSSLAALPAKVRAIDDDLASVRWVETLKTFQTATQATADRVSASADKMAKDLPGALARIKAEIAATAAAMKTGQGAASGYGTAMTAAAEKMNDLIATLSGATVISRAHEMTEALAALTARGMKPTAAGAKMIVDALDAADDALLSTGKTVSAASRRIAASLRPLLKVVPVLRQSFADLAPAIQAGTGLLASRELTFPPTFAIDTRGLTQTIVRSLRAVEVDAAMADFGRALKTSLTGALASMFTGQTGFVDGLRAMFGAAQNYASAIVGDFVKAMGKEISDAFKDGGVFNPQDIFGGNQVAGGIAGAAVGASVGSALGTQFGKNFGKAAGIAMGAASGALSGAMVGMMAGPQAAAVAAVVGGVVGAVSGYLSAAGEEKKQKSMMAQTRRDLEATFGSVEKIHEAADRLGISWTALWDTRDPIQFEGAIAHLNQQLAREKKLVDDLRDSLAATAAAGQLIKPADLKTIKEHREHGHPGMDEAIGAFMKTQQDAALAGLDTFLSNAKIKTQAGATAISASLVGIYESLVAAGVAPTQAFAQMEPVIAKFQANLAAVNATAEGTKLAGAAAFAPLAALATMAADAVGGPVMDAMAGLEQALTSTANLGLLNQDTYAGFAAELLNGFKQMEALGQGGEVALSAMQGGLQKLWELSTDFGYTLGPNEQAMLDFAVASGTVGDKFRPAADRMANAIDALVDRMDKFLTRFEAVLPAADAAARGIQNTLGAMKLDPIDLPVRPRWEEGYTPGSYTPPGAPGSTRGIPALASGGIVRRPTVALIGEKGPEAVVPLPGDISGDVTTHIYLDGEVIARSTTKRQPGVLRAYGLMR